MQTHDQHGEQHTQMAKAHTHTLYTPMLTFSEVNCGEKTAFTHIHLRETQWIDEHLSLTTSRTMAHNLFQLLPRYTHSSINGLLGAVCVCTCVGESEGWSVCVGKSESWGERECVYLCTQPPSFPPPLPLSCLLLPVMPVDRKSVW